jgi:site-specific recombinase XerD
MKAIVIFNAQYGGYKVKFQDANGKTQQHALGKSPRSDADRQRALALAIERGFTFEAPVPSSASKIDACETLKGWTDVYLERKKDSVRADTLPNLVSILHQFLKFSTDNGMTRLDEITAKHVNEWVDGMKQVKLKPSSIVTKLTALSGLFTMAHKEGRIKEHPVKYPLELAREKFAAYRDNSTESEVKYLTEEQQKRYWDAFRDAIMNDRVRVELYDIAVIMAFTGLRVKAAANLTFEDINNDIVIVPKHLSKGRKEYGSFLFDKAKEVIEGRRRVLKTGKLFPEITNHKQVWHGLRTFLRREGLDDILAMGHFCHSLRHTHAVNLVSQGVALQVIQEQLGHSDITSTQVYAKVSRDAHRNALANVKIGPR